MTLSNLVLITGVALQMFSAHEVFTSNRFPANVPPALGCYFVHEEDLQAAHYQAYLDTVAAHAGFSLLTTSLRIPKGELTDDNIRDAIRGITEYAAKLNIGIVMDLDVRLAREAFQHAYPGELQEMLRLRETPRAADGDTVLDIAAEVPSDHYTFHAIPYVPVSSRLVRVFAFARGPHGIESENVADITAACRVVERTEKTIRVAVPPSASAQPVICVCAAFAHLTPDVFAPHVLAFQRDLLRRYADIKLAGACKDEWGFPPCFDGTPDHNDFWYSEPMAAEYRKRAGGDLVRDCLLIFAGERGRDGDRQGAINVFLEMNLQRNAEIENDFYQATKETFGTGAMVATHPTWYPHPDRREFKKNGLDWWAARRDYAQTDEVTPFCVRTALAKKWNNTVWYNMFYSSEKRDYETSIWSHALAGGRVNFHPLYPLKTPPGWSMTDLFTGNLMRGEARIRLLNFIPPPPLDCPIAVIFGHACAMNWAGPAYEDVGLGLTDALWRAGHYADLIPSSEIASGALRIDGAAIAYGTQRYAAAVLYHPEFEKPTTTEFFQKAAEGATALFRVGDWTHDFRGQPFDGNAALPSKMTVCADAQACASQVIAGLPRGITPETPATESIGWEIKVASPPAAGHCRLVDGTRLILAGDKDPAGDPIHITIDVDGHKASFDAVGVAAVRLAPDGAVRALAAGGLKHFNAGDLSIDLPEPMDLALWRDDTGKFHGTVYRNAGPGNDATLPSVLTALTNDWIRLAIPQPLL